MKLGAERKKVVLLIVLLAAAVVIFYVQLEPAAEAPAPRAAPPAARQLRAAAEEDPLEPSGGTRARSDQQRLTEFRPTLKRSGPGQTLDPTRIDPTLRADLLARVRAVDYSGAERNLFQFGAAKPKAAPPVDPTGPLPTPGAAKPEVEAPKGPPAEPPKPVAPPVNMRYYGFVNRPGDSRRHAFLLDGEEIYVAREGDVIKRRYRVVRIGVNSLIVEDIEFKSEQTLPLQES